MAEKRISYRFSLDPKSYGDVIETLEAVPKVFRGEYIANALRLCKSSLNGGVVPVPSVVEIPAPVLKDGNKINIDEKTSDGSFLKKEGNDGFEGISFVDAFK